MTDIGVWYRGIPEITKYWFTGSVVLPLLGRFGFLNPHWMFIDFNLIVYKLQLWRPITGLFYFPVTPMTGFQWLLMIYFLYSYSSRIETGIFDGRPADYLYMLIFNWLCCLVIAMSASIYFLLEPMVLSVLYVWCQLNKDTVVQFWFGTQFKAMYLPWILVGFNMILRGGGMNELIGILVGHLYFFLMFKYPQDLGGRSFLATPAFLYRYFPSRTGSGQVHGFGPPPANRRPDPPRAPDWGQGRRLND